MQSHLSEKTWLRQLPNWLTAARIVFTLPIMLLMLSETPQHALIATILFVIASITDFLDGYLARQQNTESDLGRIMDPIADKVLVTATLITLVDLGKISSILVILLLVRDFLVNGIRTDAAKKKIIIAAKSLGKWKTGLQMVCIPVLILSPRWFGLDLPEYARIGLWLSLILSSLSAIQYIKVYLSKR